MISPKLTAVMVAMTALVIPTVPAWAQANNVQEIGDLTNAAEINTGGNVQANVAETTQAADNSIEIENEAETGDATAEGGNAEADDNKVEAEAKAEAESDDKGGDNEADADAEAELENEGGDATATSGDATAAQVLNDVQFNNDVTQTSTTTQTNALDDEDVVVNTQTNVPAQVQIAPIALDLLLEGLGL
jgi:hypothetical protein